MPPKKKEKKRNLCKNIKKRSSFHGWCWCYDQKLLLLLLLVVVVEMQPVLFEKVTNDSPTSNST